MLVFVLGVMYNTVFEVQYEGQIERSHYKTTVYQAQPWMVQYDNKDQR